MRQLTAFRKILIVLIVSTLAVIGAAYAKVMLTIPGEIVLIEGEEYLYNIESLFPLSIKADIDGMLKLNGRCVKTSGNHIGYTRPVSLCSDRDGSFKLNIAFFGLLPVKTVNVDVVPNKQVVACGNTIGVKLSLEGILIIGISDVESNGNKLVPVRNSGIKPGSVITHVNGKVVKDIEELADKINKSEGKPMKIGFKNGAAKNEAIVTPAMSSDDNKYHIGLWVRDSTAGIGTLTYYDSVTKKFGALGHGITDIDTGTLISVKSGEILESNILGVKIGKSGEPGELRGIFAEGTRLGQIQLNSDIGIYGRLDYNAMGRMPGKAYPVGVRADIKEGPASILSNIDGKNIKEYSIEIQKVSRQNLNGSKGMIIKITDRRMLDATGGIVQGMSGSPILQNGKIIGAVTHVLVNDPTRGYGIFIETMLKNTSR